MAVALPKKTFWTAYIFLLLLVLLRVLPFMLPESRTWGFNHLIFLPVGYTFVFFLVAAISLALPFMKPSETWGASLTGLFSYTFFEHRSRHLYRFIFVAALTALFIHFMAPTHFLGDGYRVIDNIARESPTFYKWTEKGIVAFLAGLSSLLSSRDIYGSRLAIQLVSILSGVITIYFMFLISQIASENRIKRTLIFFTSVLSGTLLLFFGYAEYYPILWIFMTGHIYFCLRYLKTGRSLRAIWLFLLTGIFLHIQMTIFFPAAVYASLAAGKGLVIYKRHGSVIRGAIILIGSALVALFIYKYTTDLYVEDIFLPLFEGKSTNPGYTIFSLSHIIDIFNELILIPPVFFVLLIINGRKIKNIIYKKPTLYLSLASAGSLLFLLLIDPKLGMPRDWDLFSMSALSAVILLIVNLTERDITVLKKLIVPILGILIISPMPFLMTNLDRDRSIQYIEYLIPLDNEKGLSSLIVLHDYFRQYGNTTKADSLQAIFTLRHKRVNIYSRAMSLLERGAIQEAYMLIHSIKPNKFDGDYHGLLARFYSLQGQYDKALNHIDKAIQLRRYHSEYYAERGWIRLGIKDYDGAFKDLRDGYRLNATSLFVLEGLVYLFDQVKQHDSCIYYAGEMISIDSTRPVAYFFIGKTYAGLGDYVLAGQYIDRALELPQNDAVLHKKLTDLRDFIAARRINISTAD